MPVYSTMRYAFRRLRQRPVFSLAAVATLTLGIGFNTAVFSLVNTVLTRPLPVPSPERLVSLETGDGVSVSWPNYVDIRAQNTVFEDIAAMRIMPMHLRQRDRTVRLWGYLVSGSYFPVLGINAWRGRLLAAEDDAASPNHVAVISNSAWQRRFGGQESVIGSTVHINSTVFTIVGVTPPGFYGTERLLVPDIWVPFSAIRAIEGRDWRDNRSTRNAWAIARLTERVTPGQADAQLRVIASRLAAEHPQENARMQLSTVSPGLMGKLLRGPATNFSVGLLIAAALTLLVACVNVSGLLLSQTADRRKELAIRVAIGGRRRDLLRMLLSEIALLAIAGCGFGILGAWWFADILSAVVPADLPLVRDFPLDWRVAAYAVVATLICILAGGLVPAFRASRFDSASAMRDAGLSESFRSMHLRDVYAAAQVALAVVLLAASGMMIRAFSNALNMKPGIDPDNAVTVHYDLSTHGYSADRAWEFGRRLLDRVRTLPGIESAGIANSVPFSPDYSTGGVHIEGAPEVPLNELPSVTEYHATPGYFAAAGTRLLEGRDFNEFDTPDSPQVAVVNQYFADKLLRGAPAVGKRFRFGRSARWTHIVGVVEGGKYQSIAEDPQPAVWRALAQSRSREHTLVARIRVGEDEALRMLRRAVADIDPEVAVFDDKPLRNYMDFPLTPLRLVTWSLGAMAAAAAFLSGLGVYAVLAYSAARRMREIGIRVALGASGADIVRALTFRFGVLLGASVAAGLAASFVTTRFLAALFYSEPDPWSYGAAALLPLLMAAAAMAAPVRRALRFEPMLAIRQE